MRFFDELNRGHRAFALGLCVLGLGVSGTAWAEYPDKPIRWVVGFPAGGGTDVLARTVGAELAEQIKQPVIVENRPGAAGMIAAGNVAHSPADGYSVLTGDIAILTFNPLLYSKVGYDVERDFTPVGLIARFPLIIAAHPGSGFRSIQQLVAEAKKPDANVNYASAGVGTPHHLAVEMLIHSTGAKLTHVPYRGDAPALQDVAGGQVPVAALAPVSSLPYVKTGRLLPLAVTSDKRLPQLPDVPTLKELGYVSSGVYAWQGLVAPKGTSADVVDALSVQIQETLKVPVVQQKLAELAMEPIPSSAADMEAHIRSEKALWEPLIKARGIKAD